jgi:hypothetical protein
LPCYASGALPPRYRVAPLQAPPSATGAFDG